MNILENFDNFARADGSRSRHRIANSCLVHTIWDKSSRRLCLRKLRQYHRVDDSVLDFQCLESYVVKRKPTRRKRVVPVEDSKRHNLAFENTPLILRPPHVFPSATSNGTRVLYSDLTPSHKDMRPTIELPSCSH